MPQVEFHTGVVDPLGFACRLLRKAYRQDARLLVTAPAPTLDALDRALWTFDAQECVPHRRVGPGAPDDALARTPIWLCAGEAPPDSPPVLIHLGADMPARPDAFERIIEVLSTDAGDVTAGRERWRRYKAQGLTVQHHQRGGAA
jgi:DNA polymerase-3 subunit chi